MDGQESYMIEFHFSTDLVVYFKGFTYTAVNERKLRVAAIRGEGLVMDEPAMLDVVNKVKDAILADGAEIHITKWDEELAGWLQVMTSSAGKERLS